MRVVGFIGAAALLVALGACSVDQDGSTRLSLAGDDASSPSYLFAPGAAAHNDAYMDPYDPSDQQENQGHGLTISPNDREYYSQFLRF